MESDGPPHHATARHRLTQHRAEESLRLDHIDLPVQRQNRAPSQIDTHALIMPDRSTVPEPNGRAIPSPFSPTARHCNG